ncbi:MAG: methylenetetrahydrofolate reductase, partial [Schleiferiaceae bacterium]
MKITDILSQQDNCQFTFEILPPLKGQKAQEIFDNIDPLMEFKPPFIDVTYHREETVYKRLESGLLQEKIVRKRPGTVGICAAIMHRYDTEAVPHVLCGGFTKEETENVLIDLNFLGIENVVALRGDQAKGESYF